MRFEVKLGNKIIGFSELEGGDAPMGVAGGRFYATPTYSSIQPHCLKHRDHWVSMPGLTVSVADGVPIECLSVQIIDFSPELGESGIEIYLNGIPYPLYEDLFPHHVQAYKKQFERKVSRD
jgi:hypothetical protein